MPDKKILAMPACNFTDAFRTVNHYTAGELREWIFMPGMKFGEPDKWWQPGTTRERPHEGLDLLFFVDEKGERHLLPPGTVVTPLLSGTAAARIPDFLGETIILAHDIRDDKGRRLHTFYAHLQPGSPSTTGSTLAAGSQLGRIAEPKMPPPACPPHLHLSMAWLDESYPIRSFRWDGFCASEILRPGDPLALIKGEVEFG